MANLNDCCVTFAIIHFLLTLPFSSLKDIEKLKIERINDEV